MPVPRISGVLNNCPLHVLVPEIRQEVALISHGFSTLPTEYQQKYRLLKTEFAKFYQIEAEELTWQEFSYILQMQNLFDLQIMLGPVLRQMLAAQMRAMPEQVRVIHASDEQKESMNEAAFIRFKTEIQADGRYASLSPDEMFTFIAGPLGLRVTYHPQEGEARDLSTHDDPLVNEFFATRPQIEIFHQGGAEGARAGGHFERSRDLRDRTDYESYQSSRLRIVAELMKQDTVVNTQIGFKLLNLYMYAMSREDEAREDVLVEFDMTAAQVEKYLYNILYLPQQRAKKLLGVLTSYAPELIKLIPDIENIKYDSEVCALISYHTGEDTTPLKQSFSNQQYEVALTLLTPAVPQRRAHAFANSASRLWPLRGNELSALVDVAERYAEKLLFDQGLSEQLYALCNREDIAPDLSEEFLRLLKEDLNFAKKASPILQQRANQLVLSTPASRAQGSVYTSPSPSGNISPNSTTSDFVVNLYEIYEAGMSVYDLEENFSNQLYRSNKIPKNVSRSLFSGSKDENDSSEHHLNPQTEVNNPPSLHVRSAEDWNATFWLRAMQWSLGVGVVFGVIVLITCPPVAAALGIKTLVGIAVTDVCVSSAFIAGASALLATSFFAMKLAMDKPEGPSTQLVPR